MSDHSVDAAIAWVDAGAHHLDREDIPLQYGLCFIPAQDEHYDFIVLEGRLARQAIQRFRALIEDPVTRDALTALGFRI